MQKSEHMIVLDHYSHINFDRIERVEYEKSSGILKLYYFDYTHYQKKQLAGTITEDELDEWYLHGFHTYEYLAINVNKLKFVRIKNHLFVLLRANTVQAREMQKKIVKKNQLELKYKNINDMYISYIYSENSKEDNSKAIVSECIANILPYYVCVIQPKEHIPPTGFSRDLMLQCTLTEIGQRMEKLNESLNDKNIDSTDQDRLYSIGNTMRRILEFALKHICVIYDIDIELEQKYGYIELGELRKQLKTKGLDFPVKIVNMANELSHDSGKIYSYADIREFCEESQNLIKRFYWICEKSGKI